MDMSFPQWRLKDQLGGIKRYCRMPRINIHTYIYILWSSAGKRSSGMDEDVLSTPGHLISLAARGFARLSETRLKPLGFGVGQLPVLVALQDGKASTQRDLARFARVEQPPMAQMLARMERDGLIERTRDPADGRSSRIVLAKAARDGMPEAIAALFQGNEEALAGFTDAEAAQLVGLLKRLIDNLDQIANAESASSDC
ncbi:DNA-binding MarR family transcriptional regulator [Rhizobium sp. BK591]|nr:DNA-binding MarR family transcriptional regulator [Rhizobium sp. BK112]MBB3368320.1 DNA-binding MarR family transcriptional regulator [Rhizobium sp. BK077]MBB3744629.1 DNA-binding MarR family transcriptional regulator [Rhizobium sp. BK591]MBB4216236.1 DNA-binding MarR family transcriptional regulator [Rhizobium sp. BK212]